MLNVDPKLISKALTQKLKKLLLDLISSQQTENVRNNHISEKGRLISDVIEIINKKTERFFLYKRHWKSIWFIRSYFLKKVSTLEKYGFGKNYG